MRRTTAIVISVSGSISTAIGSNIGSSEGNISDPANIAGSTCPVTRIDTPADSSPSSIATVSPIKIVAGWKLCGKNPAQIPTNMITTAAANDA